MTTLADLPIIPDTDIEQKMREMDPIITRAIASKSGLEFEDVAGKSRVLRCVLPRHVRYYLLWRISGTSYASVGRVVGTDHSGIMFAVRHVQAKCGMKDSFKRAIEVWVKHFSNELNNLYSHNTP
jgi:chromosomal replication initiation ATPase DnaA